MIRYIKIALIFFIALHGFVGALWNVAGLPVTYAAVAGVLSMQAVPATTPKILAVDAAPLVWVGVLWIVLLKLATAVTGALGGWQLWQHRNASADDFQAAKRWGLVACGLSILMLFGGFIVIGTTVYFMWQTPTGAVAFEAATYFLAGIALVALFVNLRDD